MGEDSSSDYGAYELPGEQAWDGRSGQGDDGSPDTPLLSFESGQQPTSGQVPAVAGLPGAAGPGSIVLTDIHPTMSGTRLSLTITLENHAGFTMDPGDAQFEVHLSPVGPGAQENVVSIPNVRAIPQGVSHHVVDMEADPGDYTIDVRVLDAGTLPLSAPPMRVVFPLSGHFGGATHIDGTAPTGRDPRPEDQTAATPEITRVEHIGAAADGTHEYRTHYWVRNDGDADIPPGLAVSIRATGPDSVPQPGMLVRPQAEQTFHLQVGVPAGGTGPERYLTLNLIPNMRWRIVLSAGGREAQADVGLDATGAVVEMLLVV